jgi:hypothetical protein
VTSTLLMFGFIQHRSQFPRSPAVVHILAFYAA